MVTKILFLPSLADIFEVLKMFFFIALKLTKNGKFCAFSGVCGLLSSKTAFIQQFHSKVIYFYIFNNFFQI